MAGLNKVMIIGSLGRDPEVTYTQSGTAIASISVATSEKWKDKQTGEDKEKTEWHRIKFFGKQAETIGQYMKKGSQIYVEGKLQTSKYEKDGITRYSTDIIANDFQFVGSKQQNTGQQNQQQAPPQQQQTGGFVQNQNSGFQNQGNQGYQEPPEDD